MNEEPFLETDEASETWQEVYSAIAYSLAASELKGEEQKEAIKDASNAIEQLINKQWKLFCDEMMGRLETLKYEIEGNQHQKSYNGAICQAQDQIY